MDSNSNESHEPAQVSCGPTKVPWAYKWTVWDCIESPSPIQVDHVDIPDGDLVCQLKDNFWAGAYSSWCLGTGSLTDFYQDLFHATEYGAAVVHRLYHSHTRQSEFPAGNVLLKEENIIYSKW